MTEPLHVPKRACSTCPYRRDTPPGVWEAAEYEKLRAFAAAPQTAEDLRGFLCHQTHATGVRTVCRGWLSVHRHHVAVRLFMARGELRYGDVPTEDEPEYYATGTEACEAGLAGIENPSEEARVAITKLVRRGVAR